MTRRKTEKELILQSILPTILNTISEGVTVQDHTGEIVYANDSAATRLGLASGEELMRIPIQELHQKHLDRFRMFDEEGNPVVYDQLPARQVFRGEESPSLRIKYENSETQEISWSSLTAYPMYDSKGSIQYVINVFTDITERKHTEQLLKFKAEVAKIFISSADFSKTLKMIAQLAIEYVADWSAIDLLQEDATITPLIVLHKDPSKIPLAHQLHKITPSTLDDDYGVGKVIRTGKPEFIPEITQEMLQASATNAEHYQLLTAIGFSSAMIIPLNVRGKTIGALTFAYAESGEHYSHTDLEIAIILGLRASLAIENSFLYDEIEQERQRFKDIIQNIPGVVWEWWAQENQGENQVNYVSSYLTDLLGYDSLQFESPTDLWLTIVHPQDHEKATKDLEDIFLSKGAGTVSFRCIKKNGGIIWTETHCLAILDEQGNAIGMRGVILDITERKELENRKTEFISLASHELKTPLTSLRVYVELLTHQFKKNNVKKYDKYLQRITKQAHKLTSLVNDLLDISRIETGKLQLNQEEVPDITELIQEVVDTFQETTQTHTIQTDGQSRHRLLIDPDRINQVLVNLLSNAIKYSPQADTIVVGIRDTENEVEVWVKDFGIGIDKQDQPFIFNRFYRARQADQETFPGLGIGLYVSQQIIQKHGGYFQLASELGKGTTFTFALPALKT